MPILSRVFSVLLWTFAMSALVLGTLGAVSASGAVRFVAISDDSSSPVARSGSLELAKRVLAKDIELGDVILVGAHSAQGSTLGEVIDITKTDEALAVTLKGSNRSVPDQWSYELGKTTYQHLFSVPLVGKVFAVAGAYINPFVFGALTAFFGSLALLALRYIFFAKPERDSDHWFKKLEKDGNDDVGLLMTYFAEPTALTSVPDTQTLAPQAKKKTRGSR